MTYTAVELQTVEPVESAQLGQPVSVSDAQLLAMLVERARSEGLQPTGEGGLLQQFRVRSSASSPGLLPVSLGPGRCRAE